MTCVVALKDNDTIYMGADSAHSSNWDVRIRTNNEKIFYNGTMLIGSCESVRVNQILRYNWKPPHQNTTDNLYMQNDVISSIRQCLKENGIKIEDSKETGCTIIIAYNGNIYEIYNDFQMVSPSENYTSIGCGSKYALATLYTLENKSITNILSPEQKVQHALYCSEYFSNGVRGPFIILKI